ncbi:MAG: peptidoglycan-binding protein [Clostridia bacterium]|nr:peptidoglycan-binding protein [Clostridia bacterium]
MDFLKTLLTYMALLTTLSVQEGPPPETVPTPTPVPEWVVATQVPHQTEAPTATPAPTNAPVATVKPNSRYETLRYQDRGNDVKKLQKRLIELGYMPAGSADGAFGYQTYNAVRDFQRANGLDADGVAGPATLTNLYENPAILPKMTPTTVPTATPTPTMAPIPTPPPAAETVRAVETIAPPATAYELTEVPDALVISGNTGKAMVITQLVDGVEVPLQPRLWMNADGEPVMALRDLVDCSDGWALQGSAADGLYTLQAAGYEVKLLLAGGGARVTVDGKPVTLGENDVRTHGGVLYISGNFLRRTIDASVIFDLEEHSLVLFITEKNMAQATD